MIDAGYGELGLPQEDAQRVSDLVHEHWDFPTDKYAEVVYEIETKHKKALAEYTHPEGERPQIVVYKGGDSVSVLIHEAGHAVQLSPHLLVHYGDRRSASSHGARFIRAYEAAVVEWLESHGNYTPHKYDPQHKRPHFAEQTVMGTYRPMGGKPRPCKTKGCSKFVGRGARTCKSCGMAC